MVISSRPLIDLVPVQPAAMAGRQLCQWDKDSCSDAGFLKIDLLGLGMLSAVEDCVEKIAEIYGAPIDLSRIPLDDGDVFGEIQRADTVGTFQIESRAQMQSLLRTRPETIDDLTVQVALVRPGPIQGKAVHPYIEHRRRLREDPSFVYPVDHEALREPLASTLGVVVFQDQVLDVAIALAGFTVGEAEGLRRAMSRKFSCMFGQHKHDFVARNSLRSYLNRWTPRFRRWSSNSANTRRELKVIIEAMLPSQRRKCDDLRDWHERQSPDTEPVVMRLTDLRRRIRDVSINAARKDRGE